MVTEQQHKELEERLTKVENWIRANVKRQRKNWDGFFSPESLPPPQNPIE